LFALSGAVFAALPDAVALDFSVDRRAGDAEEFCDFRLRVPAAGDEFEQMLALE
jgi:hypothetical protein